MDNADTAPRREEREKQYRASTTTKQPGPYIWALAVWWLSGLCFVFLVLPFGKAERLRYRASMARIKARAKAKRRARRITLARRAARRASLRRLEAMRRSVQRDFDNLFLDVVA